MNLSQVKIYRIIHIENIPHMLSHGITHKNSPNANLSFVEIGDISLINYRNTKQVDMIWTAIGTPYWGGQENLDIKRKKQAEFLVHGDLPSNSLIEFGCYSDEAKQKIMGFGASEPLVKVIPNAYY